MSTNINITVGDNALLDAAKQQQAASRQAQLNREASARLETQATAARTAAFAAQGRDANGNLLTGGQFTQPQIDRRPAANRQRDTTTWIFDYSNLQQIILGDDESYTYYASYRNGSRIQNYQLSFASFSGGFPTPGGILFSFEVGADTEGPFISRPIDEVLVECGVYGPGIAELHTLPNEYLLERPPNNYNKVTAERRCFTPRPGVPSPSSGGIGLPAIASRQEYLEILVGSVSNDYGYLGDIMSCRFELARQSDNWGILADSGELFYNYEGEFAQDMAALTVVLNNPSGTSEEFLLRVPVTFTSDIYIARIEYNGATGIVKGYINNIEVISCTTGRIINKSRYMAQVSSYSSRNQRGYIDLEHVENPPVQPPLKLYKLTSTFT